MSIEIHNGYKVFGDFKYHLNFPDEWILHELQYTGRQCCNCIGDGERNGYAMWRGIILGYCANCALTYEGERGRGFEGFGIECPRYQYISACELYLGEVDLETLGDLAENPEDTMENRKEFLDELIANFVDEDADRSVDEDEEYYHDDEADSGVCLHIGCLKPALNTSAYCIIHADMYDD